MIKMKTQTSGSRNTDQIVFVFDSYFFSRLIKGKLFCEMFKKQRRVSKSNKCANKIH